MSNDARTIILERIRGALEPARAAAGAGAGSATTLEREGSWSVPASRRLEAFRQRLESVGGHVHAPSTAGAVSSVLDELLSSLAPERIAVSDAPRVLELVHEYTSSRPDTTVVPPSADRADLFAADVGVTSAQWGIAETGTLVLDASVERHRLVSLLPAVHVALLPATAILETLGEALSVIREENGAVCSRTITFVTGPSRTADIELTLVVGVHGPKELHVILTPESAS